MVKSIDLLAYRDETVRKHFGLDQPKDPHTKPLNIFIPSKPRKSITQNGPPNKADPIKKATEKRILQKLQEKDEEPKAWEAPHYGSLREFESHMDEIIESLNGDDPMVIYDSKEAKHNFRMLIRNVGNLYCDYIKTKK